jgi:transcriptional regulator NrdR family protein
MNLVEKIKFQVAALEMRVSLSKLLVIATSCNAAPFQIDAIKQEIDSCLEQCDVMDHEIQKLQQTVDAANG